MKNFRSFAATLVAATLVTFASAQQSDEITSLRAKAEKGNGLAQYNLGLAYADGRGVTADRIEAYVWLALARENGARGRALDTLVAKLDKASLQEAKQRLADQKAAAAGKIPTATNRIPELDFEAATRNALPAVAIPTVNISRDATPLSEQISTLTADKKQLSEELAKAWKEIDGLNAALAESKKGTGTPAVSATDLENATKFNQELEASLNRTNEQKSVLEQNLATVQTELTRLKTELAAEAQKSGKLAAAEAARLTPSAEIATLRNQLTAAQSQVTTLTTDLAAVRASETSLHDNVAQLEQEKTQLSAKPAYPDLSTRVGELEAQLARASRNAEAAAQAATTASKQSAADLSSSAAEILRLQNSLTAKSNAPSYPDLSGKVRELETNLADSNGKLAAAANVQSELQGKLNEAQVSAQSAAKASTETGRLKSERDELTARVASLASESAQLRTDREHMQKLLADSGKQLRDATADAAKIKELDAQSATLKNTLTGATAQIASLQHSLAAKSEAPAYPDLSDKVHELESRLAASNQQAEAAVRTAANASNQSTTDLNHASARISRLEAELAAKSAEAGANDLSGRVRELETQLADASNEANRARQEAVALTKARDEALKDRGPVYPNLAGRVVELQNALADTKRDLTDAQAALRTAEQERAATPVTAVAVTAEPASIPAATDSSDLQKQLAETENKLTTALRGYAMLQTERDNQAEAAAKSAEAVTTERDTLSTQVAALTSEFEQLKSSAASQTEAAQADVKRANESLAALQRSTAQNTTELAAARALLQQLQGTNTILANENYQLKSKLGPGGTAPVAINAPVTAVPVQAIARTHVIAAGDTLFRISQRYYGTTNRWQEIYKANAAKLGTNGVLRVGMELSIP